ncbi:DUF455 family protein [Roseibacillus ishigakijimensis]|uniref:DUF455 family protein n=1 Tax=Roseibacillus ishigakijimensis TaxID=454146 RepID=A0A934RS83_9BACT|nr:DUF455 family protein [Roseibacillus ishigakijimensis]MBK1834069.1 DUF455 family protein [Roseibacillus ishigakijimensis]
MTIREFAERILLSDRLADKLAPPPPGLLLDPPKKGSYPTPDLPGRPLTLRPRKNHEARTKIPSPEQLGDEEQRSILLHFFCNHELLAVELMALALLKFPDAPDAFRRGLLHTLRDEQEHTRLYLARMAATGTEFGAHSLSRMIWDHIAPMTSPLEYVSRLSLTFEQSNLDYARYYAAAFERVDDRETASLLGTIYKDEIAHVGYGLKWLRRFKQQKESDWDAWHRSLAHPLTPVRAKAPGGVPFNEEGRRRAGLDTEFIQQLQLYQRSRGRTPHLHLFNPNCEAHAAAANQGKSYQADKAARTLEEDLEALMLAMAHPDDVVLMRRPPGSAHLTRLHEAGLPLPEILPLAQVGDLKTRKIGGFRPWAWSPEASELFRPLSDIPTGQSLFPWREALPAEQFSKILTGRAARQLGLTDNESLVFEDFASARAHLHSRLPEEPLLLKSPLACAGRGQFPVTTTTALAQQEDWLHHILNTQGAVVIEPFCPRLLDFSALYDISRSGQVRFLSFTRLLTDARGHYLGTRVAPKIGQIFPKACTVAFHQPLIATGEGHLSGPDFYKKFLLRELPRLLPGYQGPVAIDAFFYQKEAERIRLRPIVEINARCSMGRIAHQLRRLLAPDEVGELTIARRREFSKTLPDGLPLNDPEQAKGFLALWKHHQ